MRDPVSDRDIKRAYRTLAREHHPDRGGDAATFTMLRTAYELLLATTPTAPHVARGRPSRHTATSTADHAAIEWSGPRATVGAPLSRDLLARTVVALTREPLIAASRKPSSALNRLARHLASDFTTRMDIRRGTDDRGHAAFICEIRAANRSARRALELAELHGQWLRKRTSSSTTVRTTVLCSVELSNAAAALSGQVDDLLTDMAWPCHQWHVIAAPT